MGNFSDSFSSVYGVIMQGKVAKQNAALQQQRLSLEQQQLQLQGEDQASLAEYRRDQVENEARSIDAVLKKMEMDARLQKADFRQKGKLMVLEYELEQRQAMAMLSSMAAASPEMFSSFVSQDGEVDEEALAAEASVLQKTLAREAGATEALASLAGAPSPGSRLQSLLLSSQDAGLSRERPLLPGASRPNVRRGLAEEIAAGSYGFPFDPVHVGMRDSSERIFNALGAEPLEIENLGRSWLSGFTGDHAPRHALRVGRDSFRLTSEQLAEIGKLKGFTLQQLLSSEYGGQ